MPRYDFRCGQCGHLFELSRSFNQASEPAACPHDGADATRLFSPPMDLLMYRREPVVSTGRVTIPPGALSCHDHGPPPSPDSPEHAQHTGSRWHSHGYENASPPDHDHGHSRGHSYSHGHGHR